MKWFCYFVFSFACVVGFLLDNGNPSSGQNSGYLTLSQFIDERDHLNSEIQQRFSIMSTQLIEKFRELEQKITASSAQNETIRLMEQTIEKLTENYTNLLNQHLNLKTELDKLNHLSTMQNEEIVRLKNETVKCNDKISSLAEIKPLQDFDNLKHEVLSLRQSTNALSVREQARTDDLRALYNQTLALGNKQIDHQIELQNLTVLLSNHDKRIDDVNLTGRSLNADVDKVNRAVAELQNAYFQTVTMTATGNGGRYWIEASIIKFPVVKRHNGNNDTAIENFKSSGKFVCAKGGLYIIAANICSETEGSWFRIMKNNAELIRTYIAFHNGNAHGWHSTTGVTYAMLTEGDTIFVEAEQKMSISGHDSTLMIVKIK